MYAFKVEKMSCGGCIARVTRAVQALDTDARLEAVLRERVVHVETVLTPETVADAITAAGYPASRVTSL